MLDFAIIGGGPAGLAVANTLQKGGMTVEIFERGPLAHHVAQYPTFMQFFSTRDLLEIDGFPLTITDEKPTRREYLAYLSRFTRERGLRVHAYTNVERVTPQPDGGFQLLVSDCAGDGRHIAARRVVVACGAYENPRPLAVPGEDLPKVSHHFKEAHDYVGQRVLVVGGRNSACEIALHLWRAGIQVDLSYRGTAFDGLGLKYWLRPDIENRLANGEIGDHRGTRVVRIDWNHVRLARIATGEEYDLPNNFVLAMTGYNPPRGFLTALGIRVAEGSNIPEHNPRTLETNVPGLYVAGTIIAGNVSGKVFIENSRHHGEQILASLSAPGIPAPGNRP